MKLFDNLVFLIYCYMSSIHKAQIGDMTHYCSFYMQFKVPYSDLQITFTLGRGLAGLERPLPPAQEPLLRLLSYRRAGCQELSPFSTCVYSQLPWYQTLNSRSLLSKPWQYPGPRIPNASSNPIDEPLAPKSPHTCILTCCYSQFATLTKNCAPWGGLPFAMRISKVKASPQTVCSTGSQTCQSLQPMREPQEEGTVWGEGGKV